MDVTLVGLRVLREAAERGTTTAAADALGYTQSAVSRQIAGLERAAGARLFDRRPDGLHLTHAGRVLLRRARAALDEIDLAGRELRGEAPGGRIRLGVIPSAGVALLPRVLTALARTRPDVAVGSRVSPTPSLVRGLRAGTLDLAVLVSRPPHRPFDAESPPLEVVPLVDHRLEVAVPADGPLGDRDALDVADLLDQPWIATPSRAEEPQLGAWPSLPGRPRIVHAAADWATKLALVAAGCGLTTVTPFVAPGAPPGVRILPVRDGAVEMRRVAAVHLPDHPVAALAEVVDTLRAEVRELGGVDAEDPPAP